MKGNRVLKALGLSAAVAVVAASAAAPVYANVYASGLVQTSGSGFSFILNEDADVGVVVQVWEAGGALAHSEILGPMSQGLQNWSWNLSGYEDGKSYTAKITAIDDGYGDWTQISQDSMSTSFWSPLGVSVNKSQDSSRFGTIYISNASGGTTGIGRPTTSGIYALNADGSDAGFFTGGVDWAGKGNSSPFKSTIGPDGHLYVADFSNDLAYEFNEDLSQATQIIDASNKTPGQYVESIWVSGTGDDRKIYLVDSSYLGARTGLVEYYIGSNATVAPGDQGTQYIGPDYFAFYPRDVARDSEGNWYMNQYRSDATQAAAITKFLDGATPINTAEWETAKQAPYNGAYGLDIFEPNGWVAYANYYTGEVFIFDMVTGAFVDSFDAGTRLREVAFDAAGNIVTVDNVTEWARIWSPGGGVNCFTTETYFNLVPEPTSMIVLAGGLVSMLGLRRRKA